MTVKELIKELKKYNGDTEVHGAWEGITVPVRDVKFDDLNKIVLLDVDEF
jgi:hypothetical protein